MFGLFGKKSNSLKVIDNIYLSEEAKFKACVELYKTDLRVVFVAWFEDTKRALINFFNANGISNPTVVLANFLNSSHSDRQIVFVEHHPLQSEEQNVAQQNGLISILVYSSLTEPMFKLFKADDIIAMLKKMDVKEDEMIEHGMITSSIKSAQAKIASKVMANISSNSQVNWLLNAGIIDSIHQ